MEQLFIRLSTPVHWLIWNSSQQELIASGTLADVSELVQLRDHARARQVIAYASGTDVLMTSVTLPSNALRMLQQVIPNALEDELAQDINDLHFAWPPVKKSGATVTIPVAVVAKARMHEWLEALRQADIDCDTMYPDIYMVPQPEPEHARSLTLGGQVIVRTGEHDGFTCDHHLVDTLMETLTDGLKLTAVEQEDIEVPLSVVAASYHAGLSASGLTAPPINLRQQQFRAARKRSRSGGWHSYRSAAVAAGALVIVAYASQVVHYWQLNQQLEQLQQAITTTYQSVFPNETRIVNVRTQLSRHLENLGMSGDTSSPLELLLYLDGAFQANRDITLELLRYDNQTLRLQVHAANFASLENFRKVANQSGMVIVEQGPVSNQNGAVSGTLTVKKSV